MAPLKHERSLFKARNRKKIPRPLGRGPFVSRKPGRNFERRAGYVFVLKARDTRLDSLEMPFGKRTVQRRSVWSTWSTMVASPGGCSATGSMRRKSGPMWVMPMGAPLTISRMSTLAEWAP